MKKYFLVLTAMYCAVAQADGQSGKIVGFVPYFNGSKEVMLFKLDNSQPAGCNSSGRYAIDSSSPHFKATQAAVMSAFVAQTDVFVAYSQSCGAWSNAWDVVYVCIGAINC